MAARGEEWRWWAAAISAQLAAGIVSYRRGSGGSDFGMPVKAFAIASLFVGAAATASFAAIQAAGIHTVDDMKEAGLCIRIWMKAPPSKETTE